MLLADSGKPSKLYGKITTSSKQPSFESKYGEQISPTTSLTPTYAFNVQDDFKGIYNLLAFVSSFWDPKA